MFRLFLIFVYVVMFCLGGGLFFVGFFGEKTSIGQLNHSNDAKLMEIGFFNVGPTYDKVVYLVVDALRLDYLSIQTRSPNKHIHNNLRNLNALMKNPSLRKHVRFYNFKAGFPTFTAFRVRSLMSGENPGLMNLISAITPENKESSSTVLKNMYLRDMKTAVVGDETWDLLYHKLIHYNFRYGSLDIRDLDNLDKYVMETSPMFLDPANKDHHKYNDWKFLVMHFIGVDHVGHYMGVRNDFMKKKLVEMDEFARKTIQLLLKVDHQKDLTPEQFSQQIHEYIKKNSTDSERILFLFFGDHGQTDEGGHGGPSVVESSAGFFAFSTVPFMTPMDSSEWDGGADDSKERGGLESGPIDISERIKGIKVLDQIDTVPVLSSAVGVPIPENNLGVFRSDFVLDYIGEEQGGDGAAGSRDGEGGNGSGDGRSSRKREYMRDMAYTKIMHNNALQMFNRLLALAGDFGRLDDSLQSKYYEFWESYKLLRDVDERMSSKSKTEEDYESHIQVCKRHYALSSDFAELLQSKLIKDRSELDWQMVIQAVVILLALSVLVLAAPVPTISLSVSRFMFNHKKGFLSLSPVSGGSSSSGRNSAKSSSTTTATTTSSPSGSQSSQVVVPGAGGALSIASGPLFTFYLITIALLSTASLVGLYLSSRRLYSFSMMNQVNALTCVVMSLVATHVLLRFRQEFKSFYTSVFAQVVGNKELRWNLYWCVMVLVCIQVFGTFSAGFVQHGDIVVRFLLASYQIMVLFSGFKRNLRQMLVPIVQLVLIRLTFTACSESSGASWPLLKSSTTGFVALLVYLLTLVLVYRSVLSGWNMFVICVAPVYVWFGWIENNNIVRLLGLMQLVYMLKSVVARMRGGRCCYPLRSRDSASGTEVGGGGGGGGGVGLVLNRWINNQLILVFMLKSGMILPYAVTSLIQLLSVESLRMDHYQDYQSHSKEVPVVKSMENSILLYLLSLNNFYNMGNKLKLDLIPEYVGLIGLDYFHPVMSHLMVAYFLTLNFFSLSVLLKLPVVGFKNPRVVVMGMLLSNFMFSLAGVVFFRENILWPVMSPKLIFEFVFTLSFPIYSLLCG